MSSPATLLASNNSFGLQQRLYSFRYVCQLLFFQKMAVSCESSLFFGKIFFPPAPTRHTARPIRLQHGPTGRAPALRNHTDRPIRLQHGPLALRNHEFEAPKLLNQPIRTHESLRGIAVELVLRQTVQVNPACN